MIDEIDQVLKEWVGSVVADTKVSLVVNEPENNELAVSVCLMDVLNMPIHGQGRYLPLQVRLRYLVSISAQGDTAEEAHRMLGKLLFAAMENPQFEIELRSVDVSVWQAFGVAPRPAFYLGLPLRMERTDKAKLIRHMPEVVFRNTRDLDGVLLGPGDVPIPNARIKLADIKRSVHTDEKGRFHFSSIPDTPEKRQFIISAKGQKFDIEATLPVETKLLLLHFQAMEV